MTLNSFDDGSPLLANGLNAILNAFNSEAVKNGVVASKGTGDYDVDFTSGEVTIGGDLVTVASDTKTLTSAAADADLDAGEFRVDTITVDDTGTINVAEGTAAVNPVAPDIPSDEVLVSLVIVDGSASALTSADILDRRIIFSLDDLLSDPMYGDGSDGSITRASSGNENGLIYATDYTVNSGVTMTVSNGVLVVHATDRITIEGTIDASGQGGAGGTGGPGGDSAPGSDGNQGTAGQVAGANGTGGAGAASGTGSNGGTGAGGGGGSDGGDTAGDGANGTPASFSANQIAQLRQLMTSSFDSVYDLSMLGGSGGGGGGGGSDTGGTAGDGGDGGAGGGVVVFIAPEIVVNGTIDVSGADGNNGQDGSTQGGGGGGAGGTGGFVGFYGAVVNNNGTVTLSGGTGGTGGAGSGGTGGGDGGDGASGVLIETP